MMHWLRIHFSHLNSYLKMGLMIIMDPELSPEKLSCFNLKRPYAKWGKDNSRKSILKTLKDTIFFFLHAFQDP